MEANIKINELTRRVTRRLRLLALQDHLALALFAGGLLSALMIGIVKWRALPIPAWLLTVASFAFALAVFLIRWRLTRPAEHEAVFLIDNSLNLEDRFTTASAVLRYDLPASAVHQALLEDAANRISESRAEAIAPYLVKKSYLFSLVALLAFGVALLLPEKTLPGTVEIIEAREDIQAAGEQLEKNSIEIEKFTPPQSVTANLAKEQAELGKALRRSTESRAEVLKKLSLLEDRIRQRAEELKSTRADDIVAAAEKTLRPALSSPKDRNSQQPSTEKEASENPTDAVSSPKSSRELSGNKSTQKKLDEKADQTAVKYNQADGKSTNPEPKSDASNLANREKAEQKQSPIEQKSDKSEPNLSEKGSQPVASQPSSDKRTTEQNSKGQNPSSDPGLAQQPKTPQAGDQSLPKAGDEASKETLGEEQQSKEPKEGDPVANPLSDLAAQQTAKAMPMLSDQLMKKAEELRDGKLKPEEIKNLALSAGQLAKQLAPLAQNKEFQQALLQMAKNINPEQLEQVAKEILKNEKLKQELEAAAKLLAENQEVKKMVAGLKRMGEEMARDWQRQNGIDPNQPGGAEKNSESRRILGNETPQGLSKGSPQGTQTARSSGDRSLQGQGKESKLGGKLQQKPGGEYVYSGARPGVGAVRIPYSSAYPQYRREAERTVERSQVPSHMRSMIRNYFDAINPDAKKSN